MMPTLLGYTLIVETIFRCEGLGYQLVQSILKRDYTLAQTLAMLFTAVVILFELPRRHRPAARSTRASATGRGPTG